MASPVVLRFASLTPAKLGAVKMHAQRSGGDLDHIDVSRTSENELLIGGQDWADDVRAQVDLAAAQNLRNECEALSSKGRKKDLAERRRRGLEDPWRASKEGPIREAVLTANADFFIDEGFGDLGFWNEEKVAKFKERGEAFFAEHFPGQVAHLRLDRDEGAPHFHAVIVPWHEKTSARRGTQRMIQPSSNALLKNYERAQDVAGEFFADLGLTRGERRAERRREAVEKGRPPEAARSHVRPHEWRAAQAESLAADVEKVRAREAAADAKMNVAEKREREVGALERGLDALERAELEFRPANEKKRDRLVYGSAAPEPGKRRDALAEAVRPAYERLVAIGRRVWSIGEQARETATYALSAREESIEARERVVEAQESEVRRDAAIVSAARRKAGCPPDTDIEQVRTKRRARYRDDDAR